MKKMNYILKKLFFKFEGIEMSKDPSNVRTAFKLLFKKNETEINVGI